MLTHPYRGFVFVASVIVCFVLNKVSMGKVSLEYFGFAFMVITLPGLRSQ